MTDLTPEQIQKLAGPARRAWSDYHEERQNFKALFILCGIFGFLGFVLLSVISGFIWAEAKYLSMWFLVLAIAVPALSFEGNKAAGAILRRRLNAGLNLSNHRARK